MPRRTPKRRPARPAKTSKKSRRLLGGAVSKVGRREVTMGEKPVSTPSAPREHPPRPAEGVIDFTAVGREIRSIVSRRRELLTLLGSIFAGLGIFLNNVLHKDL